MSWRYKTADLINQTCNYGCNNLKLLRTISNCYNTQNYSENDKQKNSNFRRNLRYCTFSIACGMSALGLYYFRSNINKINALESENIINTPGVKINKLPTYTLEEVGKHDNEKDGIWVCYKQGVYDITEFIMKHPGGPEKIIMAAGASIEPFWMIFANHNVPEIYRLLESMRIGNLDTSMDNKNEEQLHDPYGNEPRRHKSLIINGPKPFCGETPANMLVQSFLTPLDFFYVRNHLPVPEVDINNYELEIAIEDETKKILDFELLKKYPQYTITTAVMCGGNRRSEMHAVKPLKGLSWSVGAVGNATWTGVRLCDILEDLKINENDWNHIQFEGLDLDPSGVPYGASIPVSRALDPRADVLLAYQMNGQPIPRDHGFPVRVIVPGVVGARNVKWLSKIIVSKEESHSQFQRGDYKGFSPSVDWDSVDFSKSPAIQDMPVISAICSPLPGERVQVIDGKICVKGYAWSGGGKKIIRVDLTTDQGQSWHTADHLVHDNEAKEGRHWAWTLWTANIPVNSTKNELEIWAKAVDASYNVQPETFENIWNLRGLLCNAYHRVKVVLNK